MKWFRRRTVVPAEWVAEEQDTRVLDAAIETVGEIIPLARATGSTELVDQLLDLRLILDEGKARHVRSHADRG